MVIVERVSMMYVLGTHGGFAFALFQGWHGGLKYFWKISHSNFSFQNKFIIFLSCGLLVDILRMCVFKSLSTDDGGYENRNVFVLLIIKSRTMKNCNY